MIQVPHLKYIWLRRNWANEETVMMMMMIMAMTRDDDEDKWELLVVKQNQFLFVLFFMSQLYQTRSGYLHEATYPAVISSKRGIVQAPIHQVISGCIYIPRGKQISINETIRFKMKLGFLTKYQIDCSCTLTLHFYCMWKGNSSLGSSYNELALWDSKLPFQWYFHNSVKMGGNVDFFTRERFQNTKLL